jgi:hypothetical protein
MTNSRTKGKKGELELAKVLYARFGLELTRELEQTRSGGYDLGGWEGVNIEVKRYAKIHQADLEKFWEQACSQCQNGGIPLLAYRGDKQGWRFMLRPADWGVPAIREPVIVDIEGLSDWNILKEYGHHAS